MEELLKKMTQIDLTNLNTQEKIDYYNHLIDDVDKFMNNINIDIENYEKLLEIKKTLLSKVYALKHGLV